MDRDEFWKVEAQCIALAKCSSTFISRTPSREKFIPRPPARLNPQTIPVVSSGERAQWFLSRAIASALGLCRLQDRTALHAGVSLCDHILSSWLSMGARTTAFVEVHSVDVFRVRVA